MIDNGGTRLYWDIQLRNIQKDGGAWTDQVKKAGMLKNNKITIDDILNLWKSLV